jgi:REP element-mobilizing transposase RayT
MIIVMNPIDELYKDKYRVPSARLQTWDYSWNAAYFVTICTRERLNYFGHIDGDKMRLSNPGVIADIMWHEIKNHSRDVELGEFIVMPNHIHGILIFSGDERQIIESAAQETRHALSLRKQETVSPLPPNQSPSDPGQTRFQNQGRNTLSSLIGSYKSAVTRHANRLNLEFAWQARFHDHIIRDEESFDQISEYIRDNPLKWTEDKFYND